MFFDKKYCAGKPLETPVKSYFQRAPYQNSVQTKTYENSAEDQDTGTKILTKKA